MSFAFFRSREEYMTILLKDLCTYYGYNEYLMGKFMNLFPSGSEVCVSLVLHFCCHQRECGELFRIRIH